MSQIAWIATHLAEIMDTQDFVYLADDDLQAEALASAVRALRVGEPVFHIPSSDALPGDEAPASPANVGARVSALRGLHLARTSGVGQIGCILSGEASARRYPAPQAFGNAPPRLAVGDTIELGTIAATLEDLGYFPDERVDEPGEMAIRGDVIDIFPADAGRPARLDIMDGRIVSIRSYDPLTQRGTGELEAIEIGRASEPALGEATSILSHLRAGLILFSEKADTRRRRFLQMAMEAAQGRADRADAVDEELWSRELSAWKVGAIEDPAEALPRFAETRSPLTALSRYAKPLLAQGRAFVLAGSERDLRFLRAKIAGTLDIELLPLAGLKHIEEIAPGQGGAIELPVDSGFVADRYILVAAADLLGSRALVGDVPANRFSLWSAGGEVRIGDVVVHEDHGVGLVRGLEPDPAAQGGAAEMIVLEYAAGARRLVRHDEAGRIWRYGADADAVTLDKLDGSSWRKRRGEIEAAIAASAQGLAELAAARAKLQAPVIDPDPARVERFAAGFPFNETPDQARAIAAVRDDLASGKPMDRLVVGDVGFGKTEIALRAAALAALAGYQVVIAAPTTVLVRQHMSTFSRRFAGSGIEVASLSRLSSASERKVVAAGLADGSIDIVIGTGAVMAKSVRYANRGLVVIDEEQRFGAADKARLRGTGDTHLLTLSATPIPRTLQMAVVGLQQISVIATPPARRQPIRISIDTFDDARIRTALLREKSRGGQSFVVAPRIEDLPQLAEKLRRLVPALHLVEAHGKMPSSDLDGIMVDFAAGKGDVLLATNIIEAGLDVPRANTMIVWRADRFGLSQLHQLRGRVGRGNRRGQVILLTAEDSAMSARTLERLRTLATFDRLGAGFDISARDLDLRGAGDLLGETQAGHMKLIGVDLYQHLLGAAIKTARGETVDQWTPELNIGPAGTLPDDWIPEADLRLALYVRLARIEDEGELVAFEEELLDRFGPLPEAAQQLMGHARLRLGARASRIIRVDAGPAAIAVTPHRDFSADAKAYGLVEKGDRLLLLEAIPDSGRLSRIQLLLDSFADG